MNDGPCSVWKLCGDAIRKVARFVIDATKVFWGDWEQYAVIGGMFYVFIGIALGVMPLHAEAGEAGYTFKKIGVPDSLNDKGEVIVNYHYIYYIKSNTTISLMSFPDFPKNAIASGIDNIGKIVGTGWNGIIQTYAFIYDIDTKTCTLLDIPTNSNNKAYAYSISNGNVVIGGYSERGKCADLHRGFIFNNNIYITLDSPNITVQPSCPDEFEGYESYGTFLFDININSKIVGQYINFYYYDFHGNLYGDYTPHGFIYDSDTWTGINYPNAINTIPHGINDKDQIVGQYRDASNNCHGFLYDSVNDIWITLDPPASWNCTYPSLIDINNNGQITGSCFTNTYPSSTIGFIATPAPDTAPSELTLAKMSNATYDYCDSGSVPRDIDGYKFVAVPGQHGANAFCAEVYKKDDQVVVAFRGTEQKNLFNRVKDAWADVSFVNGTASFSFISKVSQAVFLLQNTLSRFKTARITLTGHSLGGAIAQVIGAKTQLPTVAFDAPGSGLLMNDNNIQSVLSPLNNTEFNNSGINKRIRLYGDQVSLVGQPISESVTTTLDTDPIFYPYAGDTSCALVNHDIGLLILQLQKGATQTPGITGPTNSVLIKAGAVFVWGYTFAFEVMSTFDHFGIDPSAANDYTFLGNPGSPPLASLSLPFIPGINAYCVSVFANNTWGPQQTLQPLQKLELGPSTSGFKFWAVDGSLQRVSMPDGFIFDVTFASTGSFNGSLSISSDNKPLPAYIDLLLLD